MKSESEAKRGTSIGFSPAIIAALALPLPLGQAYGQPGAVPQLGQAVGLTELAPVPGSELAGPEEAEQFRPRPDYPAAFRVWLEPAQAEPGQQVRLFVSCRLDPGWHVYAMADSAAALGPRPTVIELTERAGLEPVDPFVAVTPVLSKFDAAFQIEVKHHEGVATWLQTLRVPADAKPGKRLLRGRIAHQLCDANSCLRPEQVEFTVPFEVRAAATTLAGVSAATRPGRLAEPIKAAVQKRAEQAEGRPGPGAAEKAADTPFRAIAAAPAADRGPAATGLVAFLLTAVASGLASVLTPCVFPMIPITVGFFLKQSERSKRSPALMASVYVGTIVAVFTIFGLLFGKALVRLGGSPLFNSLMCLVLVLLALMLFGVLELRVPTFLVRLTSSGEAQGGLAGVMFMALTFVIMSTPCTGPFVGYVLLWSTQGQWSWPALGLAAYSLAVACPFFLLAMLPGLLQRLPKAGGWMQSIKVTMGFLVLGTTCYFLVKADEGWGLGLVSRGGVLAFWVTLAVLTAGYLLGLVRLKGDEGVEQLSVVRLGWAIAFLAWGLYCFAGLSGRRLSGWFEAVLPAESGLAEAVVAAGVPTAELVWHHGPFEEGLALAAERDLPLFIDFTGQFCLNCKLMERGVFTRPKVRERLGQMLLIKLYTDRGTPEDERNFKLQQDKFGTVALPFYAIVAPDGTVLATRGGRMTEAAFVEFLDEGLAAWRKRQSVPEASQRANSSSERPTVRQAQAANMAGAKQSMTERSGSAAELWVPFDRDRFEAATKAGRNVIVDWTSKW